MPTKIHSIAIIFIIILFSISTGKVLGDLTAKTVTAKAPNPAGLVAHYELEGNTNDSTGNNQGVESGNPAYGTGVFGQSISFDGVDDFIVITDNGGSATIEFDKGSFSIAFWVKSNFVGISNSDVKEYIVCNGTNGTEFDSGGSGPGGRASGKRYIIAFENDDLCFHIDDDSIKTILKCASDDFATGDWIHIAVVRDTIARELLLYRDGVLENSVPDKSIKGIASPGEPLFIGAKQKEDAHADNPVNTPMDYYFKGMLDDLRIYNYALTQPEIVNIMGLSNMNVSPPSADMLFEKARKYDRERNYEDAKYYYLQIIQHYPDSPEAERARLDIPKVGILSMFNPEQVDDIPVALDKLIADFSKHPYLPEALYSIAERYQYARKPEKAKALYQDIATNYPDTDYAFDSLKMLTLLYIDEGNDSEARLTLDKMTQKFSSRPDLADALYEVAERYEESKGRYKEAQTIYQQIMQQFPDSLPAEGGALDLSRMNVISLIESGDYSQAQQAIDKLVADFSKHPDLARTLYSIAERYEKAGKYDEAKTICGKILSDYPGTDNALQAQKKLAIIEVEQSNDISALVALDKLIADFRHNKGLPNAIYEIAQEFYNRASEMESQELKAEKYDHAKTIYRKILTDYPRTDRALQAQKKLTIILFKEGNETAALEALDKLIADFRNHRDLHQTIFEITEESQGPNARTIYNKILTDYSGTDLAFDAQKNLAIMAIDESNDVAALAALDKLIADFNDHPDLPQILFHLGEKYYIEAYEYENENLQKEAKNYSRKAIMMFEKLITEFPTEDNIKFANLMLANCYQRFGDKYCGAYVVWHTLQYYGLSKPIDAIVKEMQLYKKDSISIYELTQTLKNNRISSHPVKLGLNKIRTIDSPFIQYIAPIKGQQVGHFVFCIPTGSGKAVTLDGAEEPKVIDLSFFEKDDNQQTRWDGTSILIDGVTKEDEDNLTSGFLSLNIMKELAASWLENEGDRYELPIYIQLALSGGCSDDCHLIGKNCLTTPICMDIDDCPGAIYVCNDFTEGEKCKPGSWPPCVYDPGHFCSPIRQLTGHCTSPGAYCGAWPANYGRCGGWLYQCHY